MPAKTKSKAKPRSKKSKKQPKYSESALRPLSGYNYFVKKERDRGGNILSAAAAWGKLSEKSKKNLGRQAKSYNKKHGRVKK
jgi:hypothetical protein